MGNYGSTLPVTGVGVLVISGTSIAYPWIAAAAAGSVVVGFLILRLATARKAAR